VELGRIARLLAPFVAYPVQAANRSHCEEKNDGAAALLSESQLRAISTYIDLLLRWNARINLTSIRDPEEIVTRHFGESVFAARHLFPLDARVGVPAPGCQNEPDLVSASPTTLADLGAGAGFPGIPIKIWAPQTSVTLIEANHKKAVFLREVTRALTLTNINIINSRAESLSGAQFDIVTVRAVDRFDAALPIAYRLLVPDGRLALLIGSSQVDRARSALPYLTWSSPVTIPLSDSRILLIGRSPLEVREPR
jgi:16S rRNA (guanine527-N7)-methyltransferase